MTPEIYISLLEQFGIISVLVPLLLIFSIVYLLLEASQLFKIDNNDKVYKKLNFGFALGFSLMAITNQQVLSYLYSFVPSAAFVILAIFLFIIALALFISPKEMKGWIRDSILIIILLVFVALVINPTMLIGKKSGGGFSENILNIITPDLVALLVIIASFIILMWWLTKGEKTEEIKT